MNKIIKKIKKQNPKKILIIIYNIFRIFIYKIIHHKNFTSSLIQNIHPTTEISLSGGMISLSHSIFTRRYVSLRVESGLLEIGVSFFNQGCIITCMEHIKIGDNCLFGPNVVIIDHDHDYRYPNKLRGVYYNKKEVIIGNNVVVGANSIILKGSNIGDNCVIAAGSVVRGDFPPNMLIYNKQEKIVKNIEFVGNIL